MATPRWSRCLPSSSEGLHRIVETGHEHIAHRLASMMFSAGDRATWVAITACVVVGWFALLLLQRYRRGAWHLKALSAPVFEQRLATAARRLLSYVFSPVLAEPASASHRRPARGRRRQTSRASAAGSSTTTQAARDEHGGASAVSECLICMNGPQTHVFVPCGHQCVCEACSETIMSEFSPACPVCRSPVEQTVKVYKLD